jgi:tetratricopeptide (TPR) repeat protein
MGGVGKTRLALEVGQSLQKSFPDGVFFAPLASLGAPEEIIPKLIQVLGLKVAASQDPQAQLLGYLAEKHILLILDNLEHLSAAGVLTTLLQHTSRLKLLVTSRESLKLSAEWLFDLQGLRHPTELSDPDSLENYDAVQLFVAGVRRVAPQLELSQADIQTIARIAQELQGHPLALELASSWARIMPLKRIAQELGQGYDLLETDLADLPERHRNLRAILDTTWAGLSEKKRQTLSRFSVFVGGATLEAAERVCGSHFSLLLALVNESLLKRSAGGRLEMHGLVQQYAWGKLAQDTGPTQQQHAHYFADQLSRRFDSSLYLDSENCRRAWLWLSQEGQLDPLEGSLNGIDYLYAMTGRYREGQQLYRQSLEYLNLHPASPQRDRLMAGIINGLADQAAAIGDLESAGQQLQQSRALLDGQSGVEKQLGYVLTSLARLNWQKGDYRQAEHFLKSAAQTIAGIGDVRQETNILHGLGLVLRDQGKLAEAQECYERVLELYLGMDETGNAALTLNNIGALQISLNQPQAAQQTLQRGLALVKGLEFHRAEANLTLTYGGALYKSGDYHQARKKFLNAATLAEQTQEPTNKADALRMVGNTHLKLGDPAEAAVYLGQSLELAWQLKAWPLLLANLLDFAQLLAQTGKEGESLELLAQVLHHPASKNDTRQEARRLLGELKGELPSVGAIEEVVEGLLERYCNAWPLDSAHG